jgi:hypothetical protein
MRRPVALLLLTVSVGACGEGPSAMLPTRPGATPYIDRTEVDGPAQPGTVPIGDTLQLRLFAVLSDGTRQDVTRDAHWTVIDERVVRVGAGGLATAVGLGATGIFASYRNVTTRSGYGIRVVQSRGERFNLTAVVRDEHDEPVAGARVTVSADGERGFGITDGNGFADFGPLPGFATLAASRLGYADGAAVVSGLTAPVQVTVRLISNPGAFIERTLEDTFDSVENGLAVKTYRISTRPGGMFDAEVRGLDCDYSPIIALEARTDAGVVTSGPNDYSCYARVRFAVTRSDMWLTVRGYKMPRYTLT